MNASCSASISGAPPCSSWGRRCPDQEEASGRIDYTARLTEHTHRRFWTLDLCSYIDWRLMNLTELMLEIENPWKKNREYAAFGDNILMIARRGFFLILKALGKKRILASSSHHTQKLIWETMLFLEENRVFCEMKIFPWMAEKSTNHESTSRRLKLMCVLSSAMSNSSSLLLHEGFLGR